MEKVSIIVAAYNIEKYIQRCLKTIMNQTYRNIEIIVVNDGSTDGTLEKINSLAYKDSRIIVINQKNRGISTSRNIGYTKSCGEYILFVDGDDWIENNTIEVLVNAMKTYNSDIICFEYFIDKQFDNYKVEHEKEINALSYRNHEFLEDILLSKLAPSLWSKFFKKSFIEKSKVKWPLNINYAEDLATICSISIHKPNVTKLDVKLYHYFQREESTTKKVSSSIYDVDKSIVFIMTQMEKGYLLDIYKEELDYMNFIHNFYYKIKIISDYNNTFSRKLYNQWKLYDLSIKKNKYIKSKVKSLPIGQRFYLKLLDKNYNLAKFYSQIRGFNNAN